ncbi:MAG: DNA repair protein RecN [Candidatus Gastranaerophilales bacterium]|nr:DNA repair protein RecN [Candidatus Gastranaerophilales bacterium]
MIKHLKIKDYTIIDALETDFEQGLNVVTGETGAGKSIMIDAVDIALGAKASKELIKNNCPKAIIELEIDLPEILSQQISQNFEIDIDDNQLIISREISATSSRIRVNGVLLSLNELLEIRKLLLDIHSQHQTYTYLQPKTHINLLDSFGNNEHQRKIAEYKNLFKDYQTSIQKLKTIKETSQNNQQQADFLKFQIDEINSAEITDVNEFDDLTARAKVLENAQGLKEVSYKAFEAIYGEDENIADDLDRIKGFLDKESSCDENLKNIAKNLDEIISNLKETARDLRNYSDNLDCDEESLNQLQLRLEVLSKIKRKYGGTLEEVLNNLNKFENEYNLIGNSEEIIAKLEQEIEVQEKALNILASEISDERNILANNLSKTVTEKIKDLEMPYAEFKVHIDKTELSTNGVDNVEFMIITNPTENFKPLVKVASGGEVSRVMLAIKTVFATSDNIGTVIFDEIDTGVSGKTSQAIANQLSELAKTHQILCITHQPIIASVADTHFHVSKIQNIDKLDVQVEKADMQKREEIIAKMLSGEVQEGSLQLAREMLNKY